MKDKKTTLKTQVNVKERKEVQKYLLLMYNSDTVIVDFVYAMLMEFFQISQIQATSYIAEAEKNNYVCVKEFCSKITADTMKSNCEKFVNILQKSVGLDESFRMEVKESE